MNSSFLAVHFKASRCPLAPCPVEAADSVFLPGSSGTQKAPHPLWWPAGNWVGVKVVFSVSAPCEWVTTCQVRGQSKCASSETKGCEKEAVGLQWNNVNWIKYCLSPGPLRQACGSFSVPRICFLSLETHFYFTMYEDAFSGFKFIILFWLWIVPFWNVRFVFRNSCTSMSVVLLACDAWVTCFPLICSLPKRPKEKCFPSYSYFLTNSKSFGNIPN